MNVPRAIPEYGEPCHQNDQENEPVAVRTFIFGIADASAVLNLSHAPVGSAVARIRGEQKHW
jgi:hypothetical protein